MMENLSPMVGPRGVVGRLIAGDTVSKEDQLTDQSEWIRVYVDRFVQMPALDAIGFIVQCPTCPQKAVLHLQPAGEWHCPRCADAAAPDSEAPCVIGGEDFHLGPRHPEPAPERVDQVESVRLSGAAASRAFIDGLVRESAQRAGFGDVDVDQAEAHDWPIGKVTW